MPLTPSLRHCSNKYKLAREGEKDKENDEDIEKGKDFFFYRNIKQHDTSTLILRNVFKHQISILEYFLKDHVTE